jgi:hypothetical protein
MTAPKGDAGARAKSMLDLSNLSPERTGLPFIVWIAVPLSSQENHTPSVLVSATPTTQPTATVAIRPNIRVIYGDLASDDLALLMRWIELNDAVLMQYWNCEIDTKDALDAIRPV